MKPTPLLCIRCRRPRFRHWMMCQECMTRAIGKAVRIARKEKERSNGKGERDQHGLRERLPER